jgi:hypothetical protein
MYPPRLKYIKESDDDHVGHILVSFGGLIAEGDGEDGQNDLDGNGLPSRWRIVFFTLSFELALDAEVDGAGWCLAYVMAPHAGEVLAHRTYGVLHCANLNGVTTGRNFSASVAHHKDSKDRDWVFIFAQARINVACSAKGDPSIPMSIGCIGS